MSSPKAIPNRRNAAFDYFAGTPLCPTEPELSNQIVTLIPCNHRVNQAAAEKIYGEALNNKCEIENKRCLVCSTVVEHYCKDSAIKDLATQILGHSNFSVEFVKDLTQPAALSDAKAYPGESACFGYSQGRWEDCVGYSGYRALQFESRNANSLLEFIKFLGKQDGSIDRMSVCLLTFKKIDGKWKEFSERLPAFKEYMQSLGILGMNVYGNRPCAWCVFDNADDIKKAFAGIVQNNHFSQKYRSFLSNLVEKGPSNSKGSSGSESL